MYSSRKQAGKVQKKNLAILRMNKGSFWLILCGVGCFSLYCGAMHKKTKFVMDLQHTVQELEFVKKKSLEEREDLVLQLNSREDDAWVEMVLKKRLGVVPEGQMKVYFKKED